MTTTEKIQNQPRVDENENENDSNGHLNGGGIKNVIESKNELANIGEDEETDNSIEANTPSSSSPDNHQIQNDENNPSFESLPSLTPENCTLYVRDLDPLVSEAHLFKSFSIYGTLKSIRVIKDNHTRRSLGYAFVNYTAPEFAQNALRDAEINPKIIKNRPCKVLPFQKDKKFENGGIIGATNSPSPSSDTNIFIKNLDPAIETSALYETFSAFGKVISCKIATDDYGVPKGFAYISFENKECAQAAIDRMNGVLMNDREVFVGFHVPKWERLNRLSQTYTNLFVKNIDPQATEDEFNDLFSKYGEIDSISLPLNNDGSCRGFGFVNFKNHDDAVKALDDLNDSLFHSRHIYVNRAQKKHERDEEIRNSNNLQKHYQGVNLYVKYLNKSLDDEGLKQAFSPFGTITSAKIMTDDTGTSRGFGFVCYSSPQEAQAAIAGMHDQTFQGNRLYVALAIRKDTRNKLLFLPPLAGSPQFGYIPGQFPGQLPFMPLAAAASAAAAAAAAAAASANGSTNGNGGNQSSSSNGTNQQQLPPPTPGSVSAAAAVAALSQRQFNPIPPFYYPLGANGPNPFPQFPPAGMPGTVSPYGPPAAANFRNNSTNSINRSRSSTPLGKVNNNRNHNGLKINGNSNGNNHNNNNYINSQNISPASSTSSNSTNRNKYSKPNKEQHYSSSLSAAIASAANPEAEKQVIGEAIYPYAINHPLIHGNSELASKITGMLLEQERNELLKWVDDEPILNLRIKQACEAYDEFIQSDNTTTTANANSATTTA